jgi:predicted nuclease of predicted toxin-antitoxin system
MKLLIDMNLPARWVSYLVIAGFEAVHWSSLGPINAPDGEIIARARLDGHVIFTRDLDFSAILFAARDEKPSLIQIRTGDVRPEIVGDTVLAALRQAEDALEKGALLTICPHRSRLTLLPLGLPQ